MQNTRSIVEILQGSPDTIESFCNARFLNNLEFFKTANYPKLFEILQTPAKEYQLYIGKEGVNILDFQQNTFLYAICNGKSTMLEIHENCAYHPPINEKWNSVKLENEDMSYMYKVLAQGKKNVFDRVGYIYFDVNADGIDELLIGEIADGEWKGIIYDIYTIYYFNDNNERN